MPLHRSPVTTHTLLSAVCVRVFLYPSIYALSRGMFYPLSFSPSFFSLLSAETEISFREDRRDRE